MFMPDSAFVRVTDGLEAVTLRRGGSDPAAAGTAMAHALHGPVSISAASPPATGTVSEATWHLSAAELPESPKPGDVLLDAVGRTWTIYEVTQTTLGSRWRCRART